jgi:hypothetical protein
MPSQIDPTKPIDGVLASKADLRANLLAAKNEIEALQSENRVADSIAVMRQNGAAYDHGTLVTVRGYYGAGTEGGGLFVLDGADSETADDGGSVIVDAAGQRWKRPLPMTECTPQMFGAVGDGEADDTEALQAFFDHVTTTPVGQAVISGTFKVSEGIVANGGATKLYVCNATIVADAPIQNILTVYGFSRVSVLGYLRIIGTTASSLSSASCVNGLRINNSNRVIFDRLRIEGLRGWAVHSDTGTGEASHFIQIRYLTAVNCGASARDTRTHKVTASAFDRIGNSGSIFQQTVVTVDPSDLPTDVGLADGWGFLIVNRIPHKIVSVDHTAGTLNVYPWIKTAHAQPGEFELVFGGGFMWGGSTQAKALVGTIEATRCGVAAWLGGIGSPMINVFASQFCAINIALGRAHSSVFGGATVNSAYFEATVCASVLQVSQSSVDSMGSLISGINGLRDFDLVSPRHITSNDNEVERQYFPVTVFSNTRMLFPWTMRNVRTSSAASFTQVELANRPFPAPYTARGDNSNLTILLVDDVEHRRVKGNYSATLTVYGRASRQGSSGGYTGTLWIVAEEGYTINGTTHQNFLVGSKQMPVTYQATLEDDNAGNATVWRVTAVEHALAGEGVGPGIPGAIADLDAATIDHESVGLTYTPANLADSHQYRQSAAGSGEWGAAVTLVADTVAGLEAATAYDFQVRGINASGVGPWSNIATATTDPAP